MKTTVRSQGFTVIELILVIVILSIITLTASSRFIGVGEFAAYALQEQVISVVRQVQVNRMQSNIDGNPGNDFQLLVNEQCIGSVEACNSQDDARSDWVNAAYYSSKQVTFGVSGATNTSNTISFDLLGNPENMVVSGASNITLVISEFTAQSQCLVNINPQGYTTAGDCS